MEREPGGALSGKPVELGPAPPKRPGSWQAGGCGCLSPGWCLSLWGRAPVVPRGAGAWQGLMGGESLSGGGLVIPRIAGAQQGLKAGGLLRGVSRGAVGLAPGWRPVPVGGGDPGGCGYSGTAEGWVSPHDVGLSAGGWQGQVSRHVRVWCGTVAWCSQRGGEPGRAEQWLCRPMGREFTRPAVLLLDRGMEKPSTI
jgi:hypothetical protein